MNYKFGTFLVLISLSLFTCNKKKEGPCVRDAAALKIRVQNNLGQYVDTARINIFDTFDNYEKARNERNNSAYATYTGLSNSIEAKEILIDPFKEFWILVSVYDPVQQKFLTNELTSSKLDKIQDCSDYYLTVKLDPIGGYVSFWTDATINVPIAIKFNELIDTLTDFTTVVPTSPSNPVASKQSVFPVKAGTYTYQATSRNGCTWQGEVTVKDGEFKTVKLDGCVRTAQAFYIATSSSRFPIDIFIDNIPIKQASITGFFSGIPSACPSTFTNASVVYIYMEPGVSHVYKAVSRPGSNPAINPPCVWTGTTPVLNTDCNLNPPILIDVSGCI